MQLPMTQLNLPLVKDLKLSGDTWRHIFLLGPLVVYLCVFFIYPLYSVLIQSLFDPKFTTEHYLEIVKYSVYVRMLWNALEICAVITLMCILLGYPIAYYLTISESSWATILMIAVVTPFWMSILVRTYAWMMILGRYGVVNDFLMGLGIIENPLDLMFNRFGVYVGMVYVMFPYAVLPMVSVMKGIDRNLMRAADNLGSTPWQSFKNVFLPLSFPGVGAGILLTFIRSVGSFITPTLMGSTRDTMLAQGIQSQIEEVSNWGLASALSVMLFVVVIILFFIYNRFLGIDMLWGGQQKNQSKTPAKGPAADSSQKPGIILKIKNTLWNEERATALDQVIWGFQDRVDQLRTTLSRAVPAFIKKISWNIFGLNSVCFFTFILLIFPILIIIPIAFSNDMYLNFPPKTWGFGLFKSYFSSTLWMSSTKVSFIVAFQVMILATILGTLASLSLVRGTYKGKSYWYALILSPMIIPVIITAIACYFFFAKLKLIGTITGLVLAHTVLAVPFVVIVMTSTLKGFDEELEQASMNLGAGRIRTFFNITFPIIRPGIITAVLFAFIASFDELVGAMFICGVRATTLPKQMWDGIRDEINPIIASASALLIFLTIFLMVLISIMKRRQERLYTQKKR
jgi:putative spermidine/putrescine transport system permease protein